LPNPARAWQFVGWITAERNKVGNLLRIDAISLPDLLGTDARNFAASRRVEDGRARRGELKRVSIAARHQGGAASAFLNSNSGGEKVIRFEPRGLAFAKPQAATNSERDLSATQISTTPPQMAKIGSGKGPWKAGARAAIAVIPSEAGSGVHRAETVSGADPSWISWQLSNAGCDCPARVPVGRST
jgi:hypothetical protein